MKPNGVSQRLSCDFIQLVFRDTLLLLHWYSISKKLTLCSAAILKRSGKIVRQQHLVRA
jgi:hypothetical protein